MSTARFLGDEGRAFVCPETVMNEGKITDHLGEHLTEEGQFQSDKYPWCEPDFVPLKVTDPDAADLLAQYAMRRARKDPIFTADLLTRLGDPRINRG